MKTVTCSTCEKDFQIRYTDQDEFTGRCPVCEDLHNLTKLKEQRISLQQINEAIKPELKAKLKKKLQLERLYTKVREDYFTCRKEYEDREEEIAYLTLNIFKLEQAIEFRNSTKIKVSTKSDVTSSKKMAAMKALNNLSKEQREAILTLFGD